MKIGIVGNGVVGSSTAAALRNEHEVRITDRMRALETHQLSDVLECDLVFLCLPTPQMSESLKCDTSDIDGFFQFGMPDKFKTTNYVLRSTVPIGYTRKVAAQHNLPNLVHSPEFLTARTAVEDACNPTRIVMGSPRISETGIHLNSTCKMYYQLCKTRWPHTDFMAMTSDESEAVKLFQNGFSAVKIAMFNELRNLSDAMGLNWDMVLNGLLAGGWINPMHTQVPGPDGKRGFGGSCLPKDTASLLSQFTNAGLSSFMIASAIVSNLEVRK